MTESEVAVAPPTDDRMLRLARTAMSLPPLVRRPLASTLSRIPLATPKLLAFLVSPEIRSEPWALYRELGSKYPIRRIPPGIWLVSRHDDVAVLARHPHVSVEEAKSTLFADIPRGGSFMEVIGASVLFRDPPDHDRLRRLVVRAFTPRRVDELRPRVQALAARRLDSLESKGRGDLLRDLAYPLPVDVICEMLGVPDADRHLFPSWAASLVARFDIEPLRTPEVDRLGDQTAAELAAYLGGLIADPSRRTPGGLIDALVETREEGDRLSTEEIVSICALLLMAGHETTANLIGNGLLALLRQPDQLAALRSGDVSVGLAVDELLRHDGPVQLTQRIVLEDLQVRGTTIPAGDLVVLLLAAANRDPEVFHQPDRLELSRNPNPHLAFSSGIHACLGASLARMEAAVVLDQLLERFPKLRLDGTPRWRDTFVLRGLRCLPLAWGD
jgi:cytochrome P450